MIADRINYMVLLSFPSVEIFSTEVEMVSRVVGHVCDRYFVLKQKY